MILGVELPIVGKVIKTTRVSHDTFTLSLKIPKSNSSSFKPGQFNMIYAPGLGEIAISISGSTRGLIEHTIRSVGSVTKKLKDFKKGSCVGIRGPFGVSWPVEKALGKNLVIMAGGIGLAPLRPVMTWAEANRKKINRVKLFYGVRTPKDILFSTDLKRWKKMGFEIEISVDHPDKTWKTGHVGVITSLLRDHSADNQTVGMICGPEVMMRFCAQELLRLGTKEENIYLTMERNMKCATGFCGHCQYGPKFICRDGPVFAYSTIKSLLTRKSL